MDRGGQRAEPGGWPSLVRPRGARIHEGVSVGTETFGNRDGDSAAWNRDRKTYRAVDHAERPEQAKRLVNHVGRSTRIGGRRIKQRRKRLAEMCSRQANRPPAARQPRQDCGLEQALEIEHGVVTRGAERREGRPRPAAASQAARIKRDSPVEAFNEIEQLDVAWMVYPVDPRMREMASKRGRVGNAVYDVAERSKLNDEKARRGIQRVEPIRACRSRVELFFGSPTIATRLP